MPTLLAATARGTMIDRDAPGGTHLHGRWLFVARVVGVAARRLTGEAMP